MYASRNPPGTPSAKDFAVEGRPVEIGQPALSAPDWPEQRRDQIDAVQLCELDQIADDGVGLPRCAVMTAVRSAPANSNAYFRCSDSESSSGRQLI
jgi:hypothetical protein